MLKFRFLLVGIPLLLLTGATVSSASKSPKSLKSISVGTFHTCGLDANGIAYCWGWNNLGALGNNAQEFTSIPVRVNPPVGESSLRFSSISAGFSQTCGISTNHNAYCWGDNQNGALGNGTDPLSYTNIPVAVAAPKGENILKFSSITSGGTGHFTCGLTITGKAYCWGNNRYGELGNNSTADANIPVPVATPKAEKVLRFLSISAGGAQTCALTSSGEAYCWGQVFYESRGVVGVGTSRIPIKITARNGPVLQFSSISVGGEHTCALSKNSFVYCWGSNHFGNLGNKSKQDSGFPFAIKAPKNGKPLIFASIETGEEHTCGIASNHQTYCWGFNKFGELGNNSDKQSFMPVAVSTASNKKILNFLNISAGSGTCGLTLTNKAYCWGNNEHGQLGNNTTTNSSIPVAVSPLP